MRVRILAVVLIVVALVAGAAGAFAIAGAGDTNGAWADLRDRLGIDSGNKNTVEGSGFIEATQVSLGAEVGAQVKAVPAKAGDAVDRGAVLVELESANLAAQRRQVEAGLEAAQAQRDRLGWCSAEPVAPARDHG